MFRYLTAITGFDSGGEIVEVPQLEAYSDADNADTSRRSDQ